MLTAGDFFGANKTRTYNYKEIKYEKYYIESKDSSIRSLLDAISPPYEKYNSAAVVGGPIDDTSHDTDAIEITLNDNRQDLLEKVSICIDPSLKEEYQNTLTYNTLREGLIDLGHGKINIGQINDYSFLIKLLDICESENIPTLTYTALNFKAFFKQLNNLCIVYGLPLFQREMTSEYASPQGTKKQVEDVVGSDTSFDTSLLFAFSPFVFYLELRDLYILYLYMRYVVYKDDSALHSINYELMTYESVSQQSILQHINWTMRIKPITKGLIYDDNKRVTVSICECLLDVAFHQILDIIVSGEPDSVVEECSVCGNQFLRHHGNRKLCDHCGTNAEKLRRYRAEKKKKREAAKNAKETPEQ